jgi:membrane-anchored glycerophosphoryl diester phosphodiesterase (GDPDase)
MINKIHINIFRLFVASGTLSCVVLLLLVLTLYLLPDNGNALKIVGIILFCSCCIFAICGGLFLSGVISASYTHNNTHKKENGEHRHFKINLFKRGFTIQNPVCTIEAGSHKPIATSDSTQDTTNRHK